MNKQSLDLPPGKHLDTNHLYEWGLSGETEILLEDGMHTCPISKLKMGTRVHSGGEIYGLIKHSTTGTTLYQIDDMIASGSQAIKYQDTWLRVFQHPRAKKVTLDEQLYIYQVATNDHCLKTKSGLLITDYLELPENHPVFDQIHQLNLESLV